MAEKIRKTTEIEKIKKEVDELSLNIIRRMAENSYEEFIQYEPNKFAKISNKKIMRFCLIVLKLCKKIEE